MASLIPRGPARAARKSAALGAGTAGARQVWVLPGGAHAAALPVAVTAGISDGHLTEITGGDLKAGMQVITDQKTAAP